MKKEILVIELAELVEEREVEKLAGVGAGAISTMTSSATMALLITESGPEVNAIKLKRVCLRLGKFPRLKLISSIHLHKIMRDRSIYMMIRHANTE